MEVQKISRDSINFKKIQLNKVERNISTSLLNELANSKSTAVTENIKLKIFGVFDPHLQKEAMKRSSIFIHKEDFLQTLYLNFFELLEKVVKKEVGAKDFFEQVSNFKSDKTDRVVHNFSIEESCSCKDRFKIKDNLVEEDLPQYLSGCSTEEREVFQKELISVLDNVALTQKEEESLIALGEGKSISRLALEKGVSRTAIRMKKKSGIAKVQENESILAQKFYDIASLYKDKYGVKENEEKIIKTFIKKAYYAKGNIEDISKNIDEVSRLLEISKTEYAELTLKFVELLNQKPESLITKMVDIMDVLAVSKDEFIKMIKKFPNLLGYNPAKLKNNLDNFANILNISIENARNAIIRDPSLIAQSPKTLKKNVEETSKMFEISEGECINAFLKQAYLFHQKPETTKNKLSEAAKLLNIDKKELCKIFIKNPTLFSRNPEALKEKADLICFSQKTRKEPQIFYIPLESKEKIFEYLLANLVKKNLANGYGVNRSNFMNVVKQNPNKIFHFDLPSDKLAEDFIQYVKEFFKKNFGTENCEFTIDGKEVKK